MKKLHKSFVVLVVLLVIFIALFFIVCNNDLKALILNLVSSIIMLFITLFFIDRVLKEHDRIKEVKKYRNVFVQFQFATIQLMRLLLKMYKESAVSPPNFQGSTYKEALLSDDFYSSIAVLDYNKKAPVFPEMDWGQYIQSELSEIKYSYDKILNRYAFVLDGDMLLKIEKISNSYLFHFYISELPYSRKTFAGVEFRDNLLPKTLFYPTIEEIFLAIEKLAKLAEEEEKLRLEYDNSF